MMMMMMMMIKMMMIRRRRRRRCGSCCCYGCYNKAFLPFRVLVFKSEYYDHDWIHVQVKGN